MLSANDLLIEAADGVAAVRMSGIGAKVCPGGDPHRRHFERSRSRWRAAAGWRVE
jgi:hypothetical protein